MDDHESNQKGFVSGYDSAHGQDRCAVTAQIEFIICTRTFEKKMNMLVI